MLGAGYILDAHVKALRAINGVEIFAVCDQNKSRAQKAASRYQISHALGTIDELLAKGVEAVHVLLPPNHHETAARQILEAGRHVFLEKPMGLTSRGCHELEEVARAHRVKLAVNHNFLFSSAWEKLRADIQSRVIGPVDSIEINWFYPLDILKTGPFDNWMLASPENVVYELFPHLIAFAIDAVGPLAEVKATAGGSIVIPGGRSIFRHWSVSARSGATQIELNLSLTAGSAVRSVLVRGTVTAHCDYALDVYRRSEPLRGLPILADFLSVQRQGWLQLAQSTHVLARSIAGTLTKRTYASPYGYTFEKSIRAFYRMVAGFDDQRISADLGRSTIEVCEAIVQSAGMTTVKDTSKETTANKANSRKATVLVLGGTGFIGQHLIAELAKRNIAIRLATRNARTAHMLLGNQVSEIIEGDIGKPEFLTEALQGISTVFHLAKCEGSTWQDYLTGEVEVAKTLGDCCLQANVERLIYTGTIDSYYVANSKDTITGETPVDPHIDQRNFYARSKAMSEEIFLKLFRDKGLPVVIFRPGIVIGKGSPAGHWGVGRFWNNAAVDYWGKGTNKLPFVLVDDVVNGLLLGIEQPGIEGKTFLLTDEPLMSAIDYVGVLSDFLQVKMRARPKAILRYYFEDLAKELIKNLIRHPNRRIPNYRDWSCRTQAAKFDSTLTRQGLGWRPAGNAEALIQRGIKPMADEAMR